MWRIRLRAFLRMVGEYGCCRLHVISLAPPISFHGLMIVMVTICIPLSKLVIIVKETAEILIGMIFNSTSDILK